MCKALIGKCQIPKKGQSPIQMYSPSQKNFFLSAVTFTMLQLGSGFYCKKRRFDGKNYDLSNAKYWLNNQQKMIWLDVATNRIQIAFEVVKRSLPRELYRDEFANDPRVSAHPPCVEYEHRRQTKEHVCHHENNWCWEAIFQSNMQEGRGRCGPSCWYIIQRRDREVGSNN